MWHRYRLWLYVSVHAILVCVVWAFSSVSMLMRACCCSLQYSLRHALSLQHKNTHKYTHQETQVCSCPVNILSFCSGVLAMGNLIKVLGKDLENCPHFFLDFESKSLLGVASCTVLCCGVCVYWNVFVCFVGDWVPGKVGEELILMVCFWTPLSKVSLNCQPSVILNTVNHVPEIVCFLWYAD